MSTLKNVTFISSLVIATIVCCAAADYCKDSLGKVDKCYSSVHVIGDRGFTRPKTPSAVESHCRRMKDSLKCVKEYAKCLKPLPKTMYGILYSGLKKEVTYRCKNAVSRQEFLDQSNATKTAKAQYDSIFYKLNNFYDYATKNLSADQQLPYICCGYHYIIPEMYKAVSSSSNVAAAKYFDRAIHNLWGDVIDFSCGKYKDLKSCEKELPGSQALYDKQENVGQTGILIPLIRFSKTLE